MNQIVTLTMAFDCLLMISAQGLASSLHCNIDKFLFSVVVLSVLESIMLLVHRNHASELQTIGDDFIHGFEAVLHVMYCLRFLKLLRILFMSP